MISLEKLLVWLFVLGSLLASENSFAADLSLAKLVETDRGICVLVGEDFGPSAVTLAKSTGLTIFIQSPNVADVAAARRSADAAGFLGSRISIDKGDGTHLHLASNLADVVVVNDRAGKQKNPSRKELLRILQPRGRLIIGDKVIKKPVPDGIDEWSHPYHGPDNNPQSTDQLARAPYLTKFLATPWYGPMPQVTVSSGGRLFKAFGHLAFKQREWPMLSKLVCLNAYNGIELWRRDLSPGFMIHRSTIVATADTLYLADHESCKLIDAKTGRLLDQIVVPKELSDGPSWKWMALKDDVLYALVGEREKLHTVHRGNRTATGWPWTTVRSTYGKSQTSWGYGRTFLAIDRNTKEILWSHREEEKIDSRGVCMKAGRIFLYSHQKFVAAISTKDGKPLAAIGEHRAQTPALGYATSAYVKCNNDALLFAGPQRTKLVAVSTKNGKMLWKYDDGNMQLVLRDDGLYAMGRLSDSKKFDYLTGKVLADLSCFRVNCTRATGAIDSIFARGYRHTGTLRFDIAYGKPRRLPGMRPACQDGVVIANGSLYWGPWMCDCNHSLVGVISLGPAEDFEFGSVATNETRREAFYNSDDRLAEFSISDRDWPTYRANNQRTAASPVSVAKTVKAIWTTKKSQSKSRTTAPVTAGGLVFVSGTDGAVRAIDAATGAVRWTSYTGAAVSYPPTIADGRVFVGSGDGWAYAFEAATGRLLWRFRGAPIERRIPVYGQLMSTWPVASGILVQDGLAYFAAGIICHDGTHVYAVDAATGKLKWQNNDAGNLLGADEVVGVSVQGHLLMHEQQLHLAGGNVVSPARFDINTGRCLNILDQQPNKSLDDHWKMQRAARGSELFVVSDKVVVAGDMLYSPPQAGPPSRYYAKYLLQASAGDVIIQGTDRLMVRVDPKAGPDGKPKVIWKNQLFGRTLGLVMAKNAVLVVGELRNNKPKAPMQPVLVALDPEDGHTIWSQPLPASATKWGIAFDRDGRIVLTLVDGRVMCFDD